MECMKQWASNDRINENLGTKKLIILYHETVGLKGFDVFTINYSFLANVRKYSQS